MFGIPGPNFGAPVFGGQPAQFPVRPAPITPQFDNAEIMRGRPSFPPPPQPTPVLVPFRPQTAAENIGQQLAHAVILRMLGAHQAFHGDQGFNASPATRAILASALAGHHFQPTNDTGFGPFRY